MNEHRGYMVSDGGVLPLVCCCCRQVVGVINTRQFMKDDAWGDWYICRQCQDAATEQQVDEALQLAQWDRSWEHATMTVVAAFELLPGIEHF